eukprot:CAMPEP_0114995574 /NCGR_PEP_ID=MMETSP0216-20121206/13810_1 /TAXON_ID=223996 /ORGANISM="Protocruzia adherens, Strain Boccale" /LENGTH=418 /DNA_ID=CAMNT_0002359641 /DNA_START=8 /DNA_END=1264 /DNA_ORIENTATION=-
MDRVRVAQTHKQFKSIIQSHHSSRSSRRSSRGLPNRSVVHDEVESVYLTELVNQSTPQVNLNRSSIGEDLAQLEKKENKVELKVERAKPPVNIDGPCCDLPPNVKLKRVKGNVYNTVELKNSIKDKWWAEFDSPQSTAIICDSFWLVICKLFKTGQYIDTEELLLDRIAANYVSLFVKVDKDFKNIFFEYYFDALAQSVFYSLFYAYPKSRTKFNDDFKKALVELFSETLTGIKVSGATTKKWRLDLGAGDVLAQNSTQKSRKKKEEASFLPELDSDTTRSFCGGYHEKKRLHYSPLVRRYLSAHRYQTVNCVQPWKKTFGQRRRNQDDIDKKFSLYMKIANDTANDASKAKDSYLDQRNKTNSFIAAQDSDMKEHSRLLDKKKRQRILTNPIYYSNKIAAKYLSEGLARNYSDDSLD